MYIVYRYILSLYLISISNTSGNVLPIPSANGGTISPTFCVCLISLYSSFTDFSGITLPFTTSNGSLNLLFLNQLS